MNKFIVRTTKSRCEKRIRKEVRNPQNADTQKCFVDARSFLYYQIDDEKAKFLGY